MPAEDYHDLITEHAQLCSRIDELERELSQRPKARPAIEQRVHKVRPEGAHCWTVSLRRVDGRDRAWITVYRDDIGREPRPGDLLTVIPPHAIAVREDDGEDDAFDAWMRQVDEHIANQLGGLTSEDLPDHAYADAFADERDPREVAVEVIVAAGGEEGDLDG